MNVGLYSGAAGMRVGQDYQQLITENLSLQSVPGYKQTIPIFSTDPQAATERTPQATHSGNPAAISTYPKVCFPSPHGSTGRRGSSVFNSSKFAGQFSCWY